MRSVHGMLVAAALIVSGPAWAVCVFGPVPACGPELEHAWRDGPGPVPAALAKGCARSLLALHGPRLLPA